MVDLEDSPYNVTGRRVTVAQLREALAKLPQDAELFPNGLGNLIVRTDGLAIGYLNIRSGKNEGLLADYRSIGGDLQPWADTPPE